jgi:hypothetical protein
VDPASVVAGRDQLDNPVTEQNQIETKTKSVSIICSKINVGFTIL